MKKFRVGNVLVTLAIFFCSTISFADILGKAQPFGSLKPCTEKRKDKVTAVTGAASDENGLIFAGDYNFFVICVQTDEELNTWNWVAVNSSPRFSSNNKVSGLTVSDNNIAMWAPFITAGGVTINSVKMSISSPLVIRYYTNLPTCDNTLVSAGFNGVGDKALAFDLDELCVCTLGSGWAPYDGSGTCD